MLQIFLKVLQKYCKLFGYFEHVWLPLPKVDHQLVETICVYLQGKSLTSQPKLFWRYCKDMQTSNFGYFGHALLQTPKIIVSSYR